ncbi:MAG: hypothetical protein V4617_08625, partial [Gemmatimonadota bacterium]
MTSASVFPDSDVNESDDVIESDDVTESGSIEASVPSDDAPIEDVPAEETAPEIVSLAIPDRADAPISEITERFFKAIVAKVPVDRIEELHLFAPLRQGGVETGIAVIAARVIPPPPVEAPLVLALDDAVTQEAELPEAELPEAELPEAEL